MRNTVSGVQESEIFIVYSQLNPNSTVGQLTIPDMYYRSASH